MQDLTVNLVFIYPKEYMGTKNTGRGGSSSTSSVMVEQRYAMGTKSATYRNQTDLKA